MLLFDGSWFYSCFLFGFSSWRHGVLYQHLIISEIFETPVEASIVLCGNPHFVYTYSIDWSVRSIQSSYTHTFLLVIRFLIFQYLTAWWRDQCFLWQQKLDSQPRKILVAAPASAKNEVIFIYPTYVYPTFSVFPVVVDVVDEFAFWQTFLWMPEVLLLNGY